MLTREDGVPGPYDNGPTPGAAYTSHLFMIRVWQEVISHTDTEWRGRLQHVQSGQACYFRDWRALVENLLAMLPDGGASPLAAHRTDGGSPPQTRDGLAPPARTEGLQDEKTRDGRDDMQ